MIHTFVLVVLSVMQRQCLLAPSEFRKANISDDFRAEPVARTRPSLGMSISSGWPRRPIGITVAAPAR